MKSLVLILFISLVLVFGFTSSSYKIAQLKYNGGGDWYANRTALPNLIAFCNKNLGTNFNDEPVNVEVGSAEIFNYPFVYMTGHGNVVFSDQEAQNLRKYLIGGGFLHIDDNYGLNVQYRNCFLINLSSINPFPVNANIIPICLPDLIHKAMFGRASLFVPHHDDIKNTFKLH